MPCISGPPVGSTDIDERELDVITRLACDRCQEIEARGGTVPDWAAAWWAKHKEDDAARREADATARKQADVRRQAIAKLTPEERAELGV